MDKNKFDKITRPKFDSAVILEDLNFFKKNASWIQQTEDLWNEDEICIDMKK